MRIRPRHAGLLWLSCIALASACDDDDDGNRRRPRLDAATDGGDGTGGGGGNGDGTGGNGDGDGGQQPMDASVQTGGAGGMGGDASAAPDGALTGQPCAPNDGRCIFRNDTFGDEQLWTDVLRLHEVVGTLTPTTALGVGLKVDATAVPSEVLASADLDDPATTVALLGLDAVVGVRATVEDGEVTRIGITCALCHSVVDDSVAPGIGEPLDGWPNRDLDPGAIIALTPGLPDLADELGVPVDDLRAALNSWGPGYYDARFNQDLINLPVLIPPAYGLSGVELETYTGDGPVSYWNAYVAVTQMGGHGNFEDERIGLDIVQEPDLVTPKLRPLREYQFSLDAPPPPDGSFDEDAADRGALVFQGDGQCATCHAGDSFTDAPVLHDAEEVGQDPEQAERSPTGQYRTTPLQGVWQHPPYFHDGSAQTLADVIEHYDTLLELDLTPPQKADLEQYLLSL